MDPFVYRVDEMDRIIEVRDPWDQFAAANQGSGALAARVLGRKLFDFISGESVREMYAAILQRARSGRPIHFAYRCDAPWIRRYFEMQVRAISPSVVELTSRQLREEPRTPIALPVAPAGSKAPMIRMCSWCHAVAEGPNSWLPLDVAIGTMSILEHRDGVRITHGICPECARTMFRIVAETPAN